MRLLVSVDLPGSGLAHFGIEGLLVRLLVSVDLRGSGLAHFAIEGLVSGWLVSVDLGGSGSACIEPCLSATSMLSAIASASYG